VRPPDPIKRYVENTELEALQSTAFMLAGRHTTPCAKFTRLKSQSWFGTRFFEWVSCVRLGS
jgi:hypothetical protein